MTIRANGIKALLVLAAMASSSAFAATFNFAADADAFWGANIAGADKYEGTFDQVYGLTTIDIDGRAAAAGTTGKNANDGITVTASATNSSGLANPFMDSGNAGLGVCSNGFDSSGKSTCSTGVGPNQSDDNLQNPETLTLDFGVMVAITNLVIRDLNHNLIINTANAIFINGTGYSTDSSGLLNLAGLVGAKIFDFEGQIDGTPELYLSTMSVSAVPIPAAAWLFGSALLGFISLSRRKQA